MYTKPIVNDCSLTLICPICGAENIRYSARGLNIGDAVAVLQPGVSLTCAACGHTHPGGSLMRYSVSKEK